MACCCRHKAECLSLYLPLSAFLFLFSSAPLSLSLFPFLFLTEILKSASPTAVFHDFGLETSVPRGAEGRVLNSEQIRAGLLSPEEVEGRD